MLEKSLNLLNFQFHNTRFKFIDELDTTVVGSAGIPLLFFCLFHED